MAEKVSRVFAWGTWVPKGRVVPGHRALAEGRLEFGEESEEGKEPAVMPTQLLLSFV